MGARPTGGTEMTMSELRTLITGRGLVESPRWHGDGLYFSDWSAGEVIKAGPDGDSEVVARVKSLPLCTAWLPDGRLGGRRVWADLGDAAPDGICVDAENAVWYAEVPGQRCARVAEGGAELQAVPLDRGGFACVLGGEDGTTLFITAAQWRGMTDAQMVTPASGQVLAVTVTVPAAGWP